MRRNMTTFSARKLLLLTAIVALSATFATGQSGRRGKSKSTVPEAQPTPSAPEVLSTAETSPRLHLLVGVDDPNILDRVTQSAADTVVDTCIRRLAEVKGVVTKAAPQRMSRGEAIKAAKATETGSYVVWLQVRHEQDDFGADSALNANELYVIFTIFEPRTANVKNTGRAYFKPFQIGNVGVRRPTTGRGVYSDFEIREMAREAADKILASFEIRINR